MPRICTTPFGYQKRTIIDFWNSYTFLENNFECPQNACFFQLDWEFQQYKLDMIDWGMRMIQPGISTVEKEGKPEWNDPLIATVFILVLLPLLVSHIARVRLISLINLVGILNSPLACIVLHWLWYHGWSMKSMRHCMISFFQWIYDSYRHNVKARSA